MKKYPIPKIVKQKGKEPLFCLTGYDAFHASLLNRSAVQMILVGDTLGMVIQGQESTIPVTVDDIIYHSRIIVRNAPNKLVIADMPFGSIGVSLAEDLRQCIRVFKESGVGALKIEGAATWVLEIIQRLQELGIPVMGHIGFQPQSVHLNGYRIEGKTQESRTRLLREAKALEKVGIFGIVLECIIEEVAQEITKELRIPTIGIGSGKAVDGQVLVLLDLLGMTEGHLPSFVRKYANFYETAQAAIEQWMSDVKLGNYPSVQETYQK